MKLTAENVHNIFMGCLFEDGENTDSHIIGDGVSMRVGFNPIRLETNKQSIVEMLKQLPDAFKEEIGGGMSFLNMCVDKDDELWTGVHKTVDELVCLGTAIGKLQFNLPRDLWSMLPSGMPYITVTKD